MLGSLLWLIAVAVQRGATQGFPTLETSPLVQCEEVEIKWWAQSPPVHIRIFSTSQSPAVVIRDLGVHNETDRTFTWLEDLPVGSEIQFDIRDSQDRQGGGINTVQPSSNSSCVQGVPKPTGTLNATSKSMERVSFGVVFMSVLSSWILGGGG